MILELGVQCKNEPNATIIDECGAVVENSADTTDNGQSI